MKKNVPVFFILYTILSSLVFLSCGKKEEAPVYPVPEGMELVWSDEFDYDGAPDPEKWNYSLGDNGWGNAELQDYTDSAKNAHVKKGVLTITALNENGGWTSARLKTQYKNAWKYGFFEIRAKLPHGRGTWPAIWMLPVRDTYGGWPRSGEIDIMEHVGFDENVIHTSIHTRDFNHKNGNQKTNSIKIPGAVKDFHTYALEWTEESIRWYIDGEVCYSYDNPGTGIGGWPFDIPYYIILNLAIGGTWGGMEGISSGMKKAVMEVDYVRVYQNTENK